jgi:eukaryotic-like serine/threonine-protein kinase
VTDALERLSAALADRYRIERQLGQGGMATVYLAEDLRHKRKVALKVLKPELAAVLGAERFVQEITTTAALQHPHILPLFDSGMAVDSATRRLGSSAEQSSIAESASRRAAEYLYYVMPYIDGETLRSKLDRETQLGIEEAVRITTQVADALDYAHRQGVIHRDIKPENILLHDGRPMVADFGIALALSAAAGGRMTETGMSLGTPHYMSPEQATADKEITGRSDIYSLASVLYEMLTGHPPHVGASAQQIIMKIIAEPVQPVTAHRKSVPPNVAAAVAKALEKLPADRFAGARDFAAALADPAFRATGLTPTPARGTTSGWRERAAVPALVGLAALAVALIWSMRRPAPPSAPTRYRVELAKGQELSGSPWSRLAVSPDGNRLVYVGDNERGTHLLLLERGKLDAIPLAGTDGAINPAFSPNGTRVAFMDRVANGQLKVVPLTGGSPVTITDSVVGAPGVAWGPDGFIYYDRVGVGPLMRAPEGGGKAEEVGHLDAARGELQHSWPDALPNGRGVIITVSHGGPGAMGSPTDEIAVLDLRTGTHRVLTRGVFARYARCGHLLFVTADGVLMGAPFDQDRMQLTGDAVALTDGVGLRTGGGAVDLTMSATGTLWYSAGVVDAGGTQEAVWVGRDGSATPVAPGWGGLLGSPALSPDGKRLAVDARDRGTQIWVKDLEQGTLSKLSLEGAYNARPAWSADGRSVAFTSERGTDRQLYQRPADGSRPAALLLDDARPVDEATFSPDGAWVVYRTGAGTERDLYARRLGADSSVTLVATPADESSPAISPDGRWLAYVSDESGLPEVYVSPFPNTADGRWQISANGGQEPAWAHSGRELYYRVAGTPIPQQMVMNLAPGRTFVPGTRRALFPLVQFLLSPTHAQYAVTPDDRRFLMIRATQTGRKDHLVVVEHFDEELRTRAGPR